MLTLEKIYQNKSRKSNKKNDEIPAIKKAKSLDPRNKASVIGNKLIVNWKQYLQYPKTMI